MRFMIIVKATEQTEAGAKTEEELIAAMATSTRSWQKPACSSMARAAAELEGVAREVRG